LTLREGRIKRPSHTTVVAYAALVLAVGTGGAYAVDKITSREIRDGSIRSVDLRDGKGVRGRDVASDSLNGSKINEATLDAEQFLKLAGDSDAPSCDPTSTERTPCVDADIDLRQPSNLLVVATGEQFTGQGDPDGSDGSCQLQIDSADRGVAFSPGESDGSGHKAFTSNGFARTLITPEPLPAGPHQVAMVCSEASPDFWIGIPTLAVLAISAG
jgi:hypothetical protein